jgi:NodT family efflux transporter outer membrane factor (OMF) lipoprotein
MSRRRRLVRVLRRGVIPVAGFLALGACSLVPHQPAVAPELPADFSGAGPWRPVRPADEEPRGAWWQVFGDARLARYLEAVERENPGLAAAAARVEEARALVRADQAALVPFLAAAGSVDRTRTSGTLANNFAGGRTRTSIRLTLDVSYEPDLWGRVRHQVQASGARAEAEEGDRRALLLSLQCELALAYYALRAQDAEIALLERTVALRRRAVELARVRFAGGDAARLDVAQAETELAATEAERTGLELRRTELLHAVARLQGLVPGTLALEPVPLDLGQPPPSLPRAIPADLLLRRPDLAAAARRVEAANAEIGVARAAWFPRVTLGATGGGQSSAVSLLTSAASQVWSIGPDVDWAVFEAGRTRARVQAAKARWESAHAEYRGAVLLAVGEAEDALAALEVLARQGAALRETVDAAGRTVELAQKRYDGGLVPYFEVLDAQRSLLRAEQDLTRLQGQRFAATVVLVKALGGTWKSGDHPEP